MTNQSFEAIGDSDLDATRTVKLALPLRCILQVTAVRLRTRATASTIIATALQSYFARHADQLPGLRQADQLAVVAPLQP